MTTQQQQLAELIANCPYQFPQPAKTDPHGTGMVAMGGDLAPTTLLSAYTQGLFPWFNDDDEPIAWWSPEPRCVLNPSEFVPSKSLLKQAKKSDWITTVNADFEQIIFNCSLPRNYSDETWITEDMQSAYLQLHDMGFAHSIEVWNSTKTELLGGLYGLRIGGIFCGESMFHKASNASKIAFWQLCQFCEQTGVELIDCQLPNDHLMSLGAKIMPREDFLALLNKLITMNATDWQTASQQRLVKSLAN